MGLEADLLWSAVVAHLDERPENVVVDAVLERWSLGRIDRVAVWDGLDDRRADGTRLSYVGA